MVEFASDMAQTRATDITKIDGQPLHCVDADIQSQNQRGDPFQLQDILNKPTNITDFIQFIIQELHTTNKGGIQLETRRFK
jgi:hypothetical protein